MAYEKRPGNRGKGGDFGKGRGGDARGQSGFRPGQRDEGGYKSGYGKPAQGGYAKGGYDEKPRGGYGKPAQGGYAKPAQGGYNKPAQGGSDKPQGEYGKPYARPAQGGYAKPAQGGYAKPQGEYGKPYGKPQQGGYDKPRQGGYARPAQGKPQRADDFFGKPSHAKPGPGPRRAAPTGRPVPPAARVDYGAPKPAAPVYAEPENFERDEDVAREHILAGRNPIREAIKAGRTIDKLLVQTGELSGSARQIVAWAREAHIIVQYVDKVRLDAIYENHQGMIAFAAAAEYSTVEAMLEYAKEKGEPPFVVVLDSITDPHNLGAIIRSAECVGAHGIIITERRSALLTPAAVKASAGASEHQRIAKVTNLSRTLADLKEQGLWVIGADMSGEPAFQADLSGPIALVIGSEGEGIAQLVQKQCDKLVALPIKGQIDSLNASVAAGVLMYEVLRARG